MKLYFFFLVSSLLFAASVCAQEIDSSDTPPYEHFTTGEVLARPIEYLEKMVDIAGQARALHGIPNLIDLSPKDGAGPISGKGIPIAIWDSGLVYSHHDDFQESRIEIRDKGSKKWGKPVFTTHATHVAGTIVGTGAGLVAAEGMAPGSTILSYDYYEHLEELRSLLASKNLSSSSSILISNHSYAQPVGWTKLCIDETTSRPKARWVWAGAAKDGPEDGNFGRYDSNAGTADRLAANNPMWVAVVAAGNTRDPALDPKRAENILPTTADSIWSDRIDFAFSKDHLLMDFKHPQPCDRLKPSSISRVSNSEFENGYSTLPPGITVARNVITVGALSDPPSIQTLDPKTGDLVTLIDIPEKKRALFVTAFSSWGPTKDGRIKPDIVANGQGLVATASPPECEKKHVCERGKGRSRYVRLSGSSMAAPVVAGTISLLNELSYRSRGYYISSIEAKAALIHTASIPEMHDQADPIEAVVPNYRIGWGALDAERAGRLFAQGDVETGEHLKTFEIVTGETLRIALREISGTGPYRRVTSVWHDVPNAEDSHDALSCDLDTAMVRLNEEKGSPILPWTLNWALPSSPAKRQENKIDNIERIDIPFGESHSEKWALEVRADQAKNSRCKPAKLSFAVAVWGFSFDPL